jgi:WD40 repeat protein
VSAARPQLQRRARFELGDYPVDAAWSPDAGALLVGGGEGKLHLIDTRAASPAVQVLGEHAGGVLAVSWQGAGMLFASSAQDGAVHLWDARSRTARTILQSDDWTEHLAFATHGRLLAAATGRQLHIFDAQGTELAMLGSHAGAITGIAWKPKSSDIAAVGNGGARVHRVQPELLSHDYPWKGACLTASWSPDGRVLAAGLQDGSVHFWKLAAGTQSEMKGYGSKVAHTSWSANSRQLATAADELIVVWDFGGRGPEGSEPVQLRAHTGRITQLRYAPQGALLASGARDRRLLLWQPALAAEPVDADLLADELTLLRWSNDGACLMAGDRSGAVTLYALTR